MTKSRSPHQSGDFSAKHGQAQPEPHNAPPDASSFNLEIEAPGGKVKLKAQGHTTVVVLVGLLLITSLAGVGGFLLLKGNQSSLPMIESRE